MFLAGRSQVEINPKPGMSQNKFTLYSNGKANDPTGKLRWTLKGKALQVHFRGNLAAFTLDPNGRTMKGRWMLGGHFVGRLVKE